MTTDPPTRAQPLWFHHNLVYVHIDGEQSRGAYCLSETWAAHGNMPPLHVHHNQDETYRVESDAARWIVITSPAGYEQFLRAAGEPAPRAELPPEHRYGDPATLAKVAAVHGVEVLGPPGTIPESC